MAGSKARTNSSRELRICRSSGWTALTWDDLEVWAGSRTVKRGRSYQRGRRVKKLGITADGQLLATVQGNDDYATTVSLQYLRQKNTLASECTCPVGYSCKHAVAVIAEYLDAIANGRTVSHADDDDDRWTQLSGDSELDEDEHDELDDDLEENNFDDDQRVLDYLRRRGPGAANARCERRCQDRQKSRRADPQSVAEELAELALSLIRRFPELLQEFRENATLRKGMSSS